MTTGAGRIGIVGDGQLGRMLALAARPMGAALVCVGRDGASSPTAAVCDEALGWSDDPDALVRALSARVDVATFEFESVPPDLLDALGASELTCRPGPGVVAVAADRGREKALFVSAGVPTVAHHVASGLDEAVDAVEAMTAGAVVKTTTGGYDGRGQVVVAAGTDTDRIAAAVASLASSTVIVEEKVDLVAEWSVVVGRDRLRTVSYEPFANVHAAHILDTSTWPAGAPAGGAGADPADAVDAARHLAEALELEGVMCVEFFVTSDGRVLANEIAPRPHNSGHLTIEAAATSQFTQQARLALGLPPGPTGVRRPAAMVNLLGDIWLAGTPDPAAALAAEDPGSALAGDVHLHLYGKAEARPGRKMGHLTALADDPQEALRRALDARAAFAGRTRTSP